MARRFLMLTTRIDEAVAVSERQALLKYTHLREDELVNARLERDPFPDIDLDRWDGIIMCGSHFDVSAPENEKSLRQLEVEANLRRLSLEAIECDFPILGICYGLGIFTQLLGGRMGPEVSEDITAPQLSLTEEGAKDPVLAGLPPTFHAYVGHHESVVERPDAIVPLVTGQVAPLQMGRVGKNIYLTQFHPELDLEGINVRIEVFADNGYYPKEERRAVEERVASVPVAPAHRILSNFVDRFGTHEGVA